MKLYFVIFCFVCLYVCMFWSKSDISQSGGDSSLNATDTPKKEDEWQCIQGITAPIKMYGDNPACLSTNGINCLWNADYCNAEGVKRLPSNIDPLICGETHRQKWGKTGYEDPSHWCSRAKTALNSVTVNQDARNSEVSMLTSTQAPEPVSKPVLPQTVEQPLLPTKPIMEQAQSEIKIITQKKDELDAALSALSRDDREQINKIAENIMSFEKRINKKLNDLAERHRVTDTLTTHEQRLYGIENKLKTLKSGINDIKKRAQDILHK